LAGPGRNEAEHAADGGEGAARGAGTGDGSGGSRLGEEGFDLAGVGGGLGAKGDDQPTTASGERGAAVRTGGMRAARPWCAAGGEAGEGVVEAARGAGDVGPEGDDQGGVEGVAEEAAGDESGNAGQDDTEADGEVGSAGEGGAGLHGLDS
jgi:hypothetical protein